MTEREDNVYMAKLAEQAERYDDMVEAMKKVVSINTNLSVEERNLLSVAYKNVIGSRRASWRILSTLKSKEKDKGDDSKSYKTVIDEYLEKVEKELGDICDDVLNLLEQIIDDKPDVKEALVFYQKMKGDYYRYKAEYLPASKKNEAANKACEAYEKASEEANELPPTHPIRLGLALNFSVFYYEIYDKSEKACSLAKKAFDDAIAELDSLQEDSYKDSTLILQLLRDNLTLWTSEVPDDNDGNKDDTQIEDIEQDGS